MVYPISCRNVTTQVTRTSRYPLHNVTKCKTGGHAYVENLDLWTQQCTEWRTEYLWTVAGQRREKLLVVQNLGHHGLVRHLGEVRVRERVARDHVALVELADQSCRTPLCHETHHEKRRGDVQRLQIVQQGGRAGAGKTSETQVSRHNTNHARHNFKHTLENLRGGRAIVKRDCVRQLVHALVHDPVVWHAGTTVRGTFPARFAQRFVGAFTPVVSTGPAARLTPGGLGAKLASGSAKTVSGAALPRGARGAVGTNAALCNRS
jgi:hypothetical protein